MHSKRQDAAVGSFVGGDVVENFDQLGNDAYKEHLFKDSAEALLSDEEVAADDGCGTDRQDQQMLETKNRMHDFSSKNAKNIPI